ncbi:type II secretory pathway protein [Paraburkholderia sp. CNPSo 3155]|uniref:type II secretion system protein GspD n=1 Tax=Paraburkholderia atlantica TaxID=2654982 RepID=UPI00128DD19F|nr:type II secretory pathway protein [Paraburkholderia atlantica]MPW07021.1 type II secretory pathway protein [Paraburkholderia atlantica]
MNVKRLLTLAVIWPALSVAAQPTPLPMVPPLPTVPALVAADTSLPSSVPVTPMPPMVQHSKGNSFDLRFATVSFVVDFVYENAVKTPHVIGPDVLADQRLVSFRYKAGDGELRTFLATFLDSLGYAVTVRDGVDFIAKKPDADKPKETREPFVYVPRYRKADYLMRMVQPLVGGRFTTQRGVSSASVATTTSGASSTAGEVSKNVPQSSAAALIDQNTDVLVFLGTSTEIETLRQVLPLIDVARGKVNLKGTVYEVSDTTQKQSGFSLAVNILGLGLGINNGFTNSAQSSVTLHASSGNNTIDAALQALDSDSRFKVLTRPNMTVLSGERARLNVGQQVPTQGQVSYQGTSGTPVQSIVYQDAGVIFDVQPTVMRNTIDVVVDEEISDFVNTTTGVNSSPTKNTRTLQTTTSLQDGDLVVIGGLVQTHETRATSGLAFLPHWMNGRNNAEDNTEIVLVLQVTKI